MIIHCLFVGSSIPWRFSSDCKGCVIDCGTKQCCLIQKSPVDDVLTSVDLFGSELSVIQSDEHLFEDVESVSFFNPASDLHCIEAHTMITLEDY